jgi:hypothetical protein
MLVAASYCRYACCYPGISKKFSEWVGSKMKNTNKSINDDIATGNRSVVSVGWGVILQRDQLVLKSKSNERQQKYG